MNLVEIVKSKKESIIILGVIIAMVLTTTLIGATISADAATTEGFDVKVGNKVVATVANKEDADKIVNGVKNYYVSKGAKVDSIKLDPAMTVTPHVVNSGQDKPKFDKNTDSVVNKIMTGNVKEQVFTLKEGDTPWSIAQENNIPVMKLLEYNNLTVDEDSLMVGDVLKYAVKKPMLDVTTVQTTTGEESVAYETEEEKTDELYEGDTEVRTAGENGINVVKAQVTLKNGETQSRKILSSEVKKEAVKEVVLVGTKARPVSRAATSNSSAASRYSGGSRSYVAPVGSGNGSAIANYACQFVGHPYVYGGSDLYNGADCVGFVWRVLNNNGIYVPYTYPQGWLNTGYAVSYSNAQPGDIIVYAGHISMYIGGGCEVHAMNPRDGIKITRVGVAGPILGVRRVA